MREALRKIEDGEYWVYGPTVGELDRVLELVQKYSDYADTCVERLADGTEVPAEFADAHAEVSSDLRYYNYLEKGLLWSFALWRLQGVFEAMLVSTFLPTKPAKPLVGLRSKLDAVGAAGYLLKPELERDLLAWGRLRNILSHMPPEQYRPIAIDRQDVEEYLALLKQVCGEWEAQRAHGL